MFEKIANDKRFEIAESLMFHEKVAEFIEKTSVEGLADVLELAANEYREEFKKEALEQGYSEDYVQGVFDTSEKLCKKAVNLRTLWRQPRKTISSLFGSSATPTPTPEPDPDAFNLTHMLFGKPGTNKATMFRPNQDLASNMLHGLGWGAAGSMTGIPLAGPVAGALGFVNHRWGPGAAKLLAGGTAAAGLGLAGEGYKNYIAPQPGEEDQKAWIGEQGMGGIGGLALGGLAANAMGYKGLSTIPLALLGMYGGAKFLPQIAQSIKGMGSSSGAGNYGTNNYADLASKYLNPSQSIAAAQQDYPAAYQVGDSNISPQ